LEKSFFLQIAGFSLAGGIVSPYTNYFAGDRLAKGFASIG